jgi:hypothetical protein
VRRRAFITLLGGAAAAAEGVIARYAPEKRERGDEVCGAAPVDQPPRRVSLATVILAEDSAMHYDD